MGRHREFDEDKALEAAMDVFWEKGYEGTSYDDLTRATGVARPGLYAAFGNKQQFFLKALDLYAVKFTVPLCHALDEPTAYKVVAALLRATVELNTKFRSHPGCLGVNGALACSQDSEPIRLELVRRRAHSESTLAARFKRAQKTGDLPASVRPDTLARMVMSFAQGLSVQAKGGTGKAALMATVDQFLQLWPRRSNAAD